MLNHIGLTILATQVEILYFIPFWGGGEGGHLSGFDMDVKPRTGSIGSIENDSDLDQNPKHYPWYCK
jgi:hypothetical protein